MAKKYKTAQALEFILESITDGFFTLDNDFNITYVNRAFEDICNLEKENIIDKSYWEIFPEAKTQKFFSVYKNVLATKKSEYFEEFASSLNKWVYVAVYINPDGLSVYFTDLSEQKKQMKIIESQNKQLLNIAWIMSHKLRKPVATILGLSQLLKKEQFPDADSVSIIDGIVSEIKELDLVIKEIDIKTHLFQEE